MQAEHAISKPGGGSGSATVLALITAVVALGIAGAALWRTNMPMFSAGAPSTAAPPAAAPGYGPGMMPWGGQGYGWGMMPWGDQGYGPGMMPWGGPGMMPGMMGPGMMGPGMMGPGYGMGMGMMGGGAATQQAVAGALGISLDDLVAAERAGKSVATIAQEKGIDLQKVVDAAMAPHKAAMAAMTGAGYLTQPQLDWMLAAMEEGLRAQFAGQWTGGWGWGMGGDLGGNGLLPQAAQALGLTPAKLLSELQAGKSIAALAQEKNVDVQKAIIGPALAQERAWLDAQVKAGRMTQAQADAMQAQMQANLQARVQVTGAPGYGYGMGPGMMGPGMMGPGYGYGYGAR